MTAPALVRSPWRLAVAGALLLLVSNAAAYFLLTRPRQERSRRVAEISAQVTRALAEERSEVERLRLRARVIEANRRDTKRFLSQTIQPQERALAEDLEALETAFRQAGLAAERRSYQRQDVRDLPLVRLDHQIVVSGTSERLTAFLGLLERSPRFVLVSGIRLRQDAQGPAKLEATLATFYKGSAKAGAQVAAKASATSGARASR